MKARIIKELNWEELPFEIVNEIIEAASKKYGVKFISREDGKEYCKDALIGLFAPAIDKAMKQADA